MEKENVDNLFRESLDEFSRAPDPKVWDRIQVSLDKKARGRRKVVPLWWQLGGAAAALALLLYLLIPGAEQGALPQTDPISTSPSINTPTEEPGVPAEDLFNTSDKDKLTQTNIEVVQSDQKPDSPQRNINTKSTSAIVATQNAASQGTSSTRANNKAESQELSSQPSEETEGFAAQTEDVSPAAENNAVAALSNKPRTKSATPSGEEESQVTELAAAEQEEAFKELITGHEEEPVIQQDNSLGKWAIGPSIAPVYFNSLGDGSPIDQAFVSNDKSGSLNMSYGLQVSYKVNKRLEIRSGLHKVDFGYNTNDVAFSSALQASTEAKMKNIDYSPASEYLVVNGQNTVPSKADTGARNEITARNTAREGTMVQEFGYLEVPFELNYALIDRTFGLHLISGVSSLFLVDNAVSLESDAGTTEVGQANNLNNVNFSANFGLGVQYQVSDKIKLQVEPLLKYQLNTFSETAGDFRPYSIGIYSGIRYKF